MLWVLMFLLGIVLLVISTVLLGKDKYNRRSNLEILQGFSVAMLVVGFILSLIFISVGMSMYPSLKAQQEKVSSLRSEISTIQNARYGNIESGKMVGGTLDNMSQSTALSTYISEYAQVKSKYNSDVVYFQAVKKMPLFNLFGYTIYISDEVYNLPLF